MGLEWIYNRISKLEAELAAHGRDLAEDRAKRLSYDTRLAALEGALARARGYLQIGAVLLVVSLNLGRETTIDILKTLLASGVGR